MKQLFYLAPAIFALMTLKQKVFEHYLQLINDKENSLRNVLADLKDSSSNETKSTAGDKHETALAMLQIDQANVGAQLQDVLNKKAMLLKIDPAQTSTKIINGSLVKTNKGYLFISVALGKATIAGNTVISLSLQSPLGKALMGLTANHTAECNDSKYEIKSVE